jgi:hypothetical protein
MDCNAIGEEQFRTKLLEQMSEIMGKHHGGSERLDSAEVKAARLVVEEVKRRGRHDAELERRRKGDEEKIKVAQQLHP